VFKQQPITAVEKNSIVGMQHQSSFR